MKTTTFACAAIAFLTLAGAVSAQQGGGLGAACKGDLEKHCKETKVGDGKGFACLQKNKDKLAAECATAVKAAEDRRAKMQADCKGDVEKLCKGVEAKGRQLVDCLRGKMTELTAACKTAVGEAPAKK